MQSALFVFLYDETEINKKIQFEEEGKCSASDVCFGD